MSSIVSGRTHFTLRPARAGDAAALERLERAAFVSYYSAHRFTLAQFRRYLVNPATIAHVITVRDGLAAYSLGIELSGVHRGVARLHSIAVDPRHRRKGLAGRLLRAFVLAARARGNRKVYLDVAAKNAAALRLFRDHGFSTVRRLPEHYTRSSDGLRMCLKIRR